MSITGEQAAELKELLADAEATTRLTDWEVRFVDEIRERFVLYGSNIRLSEKQWSILRRVEQRVYAA